MAVRPFLHTPVPGHCSTVMAHKPLSKTWTVSSVTTDGPHFVAAGSKHGAPAGTQSLADDEQAARHVHEQQSRHWFAESDKVEAGGAVIRFVLLEKCFDETMTIWMATQNMRSRCH